MVPSVAQEAVGHEGGEEGDVPVGLLHLHLAQLHLNGLQETHSQGSPLGPLPRPVHPSPFSILQSQNLFPPGTQLTPPWLLQETFLIVTNQCSAYVPRDWSGALV